MKEEFEEKRKYKRKYFTVPICYKRINDSGEGTLAPVKDISIGGIGFLSLEYINPKTELLLKLFLPGRSEPIEIKGKVAWIKREEPYSDDYALFNIGIEFDQLTEKFKEDINKFIATM